MLLDFDNAPSNSRAPKNRKSVKGLVAMAMFGAVAVLGSTLAANISLNSGTLEFGQGIATTTACDDNGITLTPKAVFTNTASGSFSLSTISFSGIANACLNKVFTINAYGETSASPLRIATTSAGSYDVATFVMSATLPGSSYITTAGYTAPTSGGGAADIGFRGTQATSGAVYKITLQSSDN